MATQIRKRQIADGQIDDSKIQPGAGIQTTKLADGQNFIKRDGSVPMTGNLDFGNQRGMNVQTPSLPTDVSNKAYVDAAIAALTKMFDSKGSARVRAAGNVNIANPGTAIFDSVTLSTGDRLFLGDQTSPAENGLYVFNGASSALTRTEDMDEWQELPGALFAVEEGSAANKGLYLCTSAQGGTLGTTAITFLQLPSAAGLLNSNFVSKEVPSGAINGVNATFTLANVPVSGSEEVYLNGQLQVPGAAEDYTISGAAITFVTAPLAGESIRVSYRK